MVRKILAYTDEVMIAENHFEVGAVGALHHHPHTQITYVVSGAFEFEIGGEKKIVKAGGFYRGRSLIMTPRTP